ncbi:putative permease [Escherichia coli]|uniref:Putative permease n=1 Tax=Escherichia coli TaxID=562 RepID=A0A484X248_ECOLX|nr:putative permease [Escherichia coli]
MIILSVVIFGGLWGFWGVFFAIPLATLIKSRDFTPGLMGKSRKTDLQRKNFKRVLQGSEKI